LHSAFPGCTVMERAGNADARVPRNYAQLYDSASDEDVDVAGASLKRTRIDDSVVESFHVYAEVSVRVIAG
jgi:membrane-bound lytic murein transglycosylase MltF